MRPGRALKTRFEIEAASPMPAERDARRLRLICRAIFILYLLGHTWTWRYMMNPDGTAYIDIARAWLRADWSAALNAYWSPLYPWMLAAAIAVFHPASPGRFP